jgi:hypothetical protein
VTGAEFRSTTALDVRPGDRVRMRSGTVITVTRIQPRFLDDDEMICLIEDTDERWRAQPLRRDAEIEVLRPPRHSA